jgi:MFS family permease
VSYYHNKGDPYATYENAIIVLPLATTLKYAISPIGAKLQKKLNPKIIFLIGLTMAFGGITLAANAPTFITFVIFYGVVFPAGGGLMYYVPMLCALEWFPSRKGVIVGVTLGAYGFAAFIFGFYTQSIVNPDNQAMIKDEFQVGYYSEEVGNRVPEMLYRCMIWWAALALSGAALITRNPEFVRHEEIVMSIVPNDQSINLGRP